MTHRRDVMTLVTHECMIFFKGRRATVVYDLKLNGQNNDLSELKKHNIKKAILFAILI